MPDIGPKSYGAFEKGTPGLAILEHCVTQSNVSVMLGPFYSGSAPPRGGGNSGIVVMAGEKALFGFEIGDMGLFWAEKFSGGLILDRKILTGLFVRVDKKRAIYVKQLHAFQLQAQLIFLWE